MGSEPCLDFELDKFFKLQPQGKNFNFWDSIFHFPNFWIILTTINIEEINILLKSKINSKNAKKQELNFSDSNWYIAANTVDTYTEREKDQKVFMRHTCPKLCNHGMW